MITEARMSKKQNKQRQFGVPTDAVVERIEPPKPRRYVPKPCTLCCATSDGESFSFVNGKEIKINSSVELVISRACKCRRCSNTWTEYQIIKHEAKKAETQ